MAKTESNATQISTPYKVNQNQTFISIPHKHKPCNTHSFLFCVTAEANGFSLL